MTVPFAQLAHRESLRDIKVCLRAQRNKLYHMGIRGKIARNTLANANKQRDWRIYAEFAQELIRIACPLYAEEELGLELDNAVFALDASTIDLCLSAFPWALFPSTKSTTNAKRITSVPGCSCLLVRASNSSQSTNRALHLSRRWQRLAVPH